MATLRCLISYAQPYSKFGPGLELPFTNASPSSRTSPFISVIAEALGSAEAMEIRVACCASISLTEPISHAPLRTSSISSPASSTLDHAKPLVLRPRLIHSPKVLRRPVEPATLSRAIRRQPRRQEFSEPAPVPAHRPSFHQLKSRRAGRQQESVGPKKSHPPMAKNRAAPASAGVDECTICP